MADFSRITTKDHALQKVQDATARALKGMPPATLAPLSSSLTADVTISATAWADVAGLSVTFAALANERVLVCLAGQVYASDARALPQVTLNVAGANVVDATSGDGLSGGASRTPMGISYLTDALAAGATTVKVRAKVVTSYTAVVRNPARLSVIRLGVAW